MKTDYFFIYETTNLINGMKYRGIHKTKKINDNYLGSGSSFVNAIKKYGKENFKREILEFCNSYDELLEREKFFVDEEWVKDRTNYNTKTGGQSAGLLSDESKNKISNTLKEKYKNGEITATIGEWIKENGPWCKGLKMTDEFKEKCSIAGKKRYEDDKENHPLNLFRNTTVSEEQKIKISETLKERYKTIDHPCKGKKSPLKGKKSNYPAWNKGKKSTKINYTFKKEKNFKCPYCDKLLDKANAKRWHFNNCKLKK